MLFAHFTERPKPVARVHPDGRVFRGETVTLTCDIQQTGDWQYSWYKDNKQDYIIGRDQNYIITSVDWSHGGVYSCKRTLSKAPTYSQMSDGVTLTVSGECVHVFIRSNKFITSVFVTVFVTHPGMDYELQRPWGQLSPRTAHPTPPFFIVFQSFTFIVTESGCSDYCEYLMFSL